MEPLQPSKSTLIPPLQIVRLQPSKTTWKNEGFTLAPSSHTPTNLRSPDPSFPSSSSLQPPCAPFKPRATTPTPSVLDEPPKWLRMASLIRPSEQPAAGGVRLISVTSAPQKFFCLTKLPEGSTLVDLHTTRFGVCRPRGPILLHLHNHSVRRLSAAWPYTASSPQPQGSAFAGRVALYCFIFTTTWFGVCRPCGPILLHLHNHLVRRLPTASSLQPLGSAFAGRVALHCFALFVHTEIAYSLR